MYKSRSKKHHPNAVAARQFREAHSHPSREVRFILGTLHKSRNHVYRLKSPLHRPLVIKGKPTKIHPSVKTRYEMDAAYRPPKLKALVEQYGWEGLDVGV